MNKTKKKFYITTSIAYANASPHCGYALEVIQADVLARYRRLLGDDVFFLTGTDEQGAKIAKAAEAAGKNPGQFTDEISSEFRALTKALFLSPLANPTSTKQSPASPAIPSLCKTL